MNKERISLEKIKDILLEIEKRTMSNTSFNRLAKSGMALATEALSKEVTEPSEERTYTYRELEWFGVYLMSGDYIHTITNNKELVEYCKQQAQAFTGLADNKIIEPNQTEAFSLNEFEQKVLNDTLNKSIKSERTVTQTEAEKESDWEQFIIDQINQSYNEHKGSNEAVQDAAYYITKKIELNLSLARKQVIEDVGEWVNQSLSDARHLGMYDKGIEQLELLSTKLSQLKITK